MRRFIIILLYSSTILFAQDNSIVKTWNNAAYSAEVQTYNAKLSGANAGTQNYYNDTLSHKLRNTKWESADTYRFGFEAGDVMLQWYEAPADFELNSLGFWLNTKEEERNPEFKIEVKVVKCNWTRDKLDSLSLGYYLQLGYYPTDNLLFPNDPVTEFRDDSSRLGEWVSINNCDEPFSNILWESDTLTMKDNLVFDEYTWVDIPVEESKISIRKGEIVCFAVKNVTTIDTWPDDLEMLAVSNIGIPGFKFYKNGNLLIDIPNTDPSYGWWIRPRFTFDIVAGVTYRGDLPPIIKNITNLKTTYSVEPQMVKATITDRNPEGQAGVASAKLIYNIEGESENNEVAMLANGDVFAAEIPGFNRGITVNYWIEAEDITSNKSVSEIYSYKLFQPSGLYPLLLVLNGGLDSGYPTDYYLWNILGSGDYDKWAYGILPLELLENYEWVIEICSSEPEVDNSEVIRTWLEENGGFRDYLLAGENWLGFRNNYSDKFFGPGDFEYDILGIKASYHNVSYMEGEDEDEPALLFPVQGSVLGGELYTALTNSNADSLLYDPAYEIGNQYEKIDAFDAIDENNVDMYVQTKWLNGTVSQELKGAMLHNELDNNSGRRVAFLTFDPLSLNSSPVYYWWGDTTQAPLYSFIKWTGYRPSVEYENAIVDGYSLSQNYPNPFNPSTKIEFEIPVETSYMTSLHNVKLVVYDILGREIATLVNEQQKPGKYSIDFDLNSSGTNLPSGIYFYRLSAGKFSKTRKMMFLK